MNKNGNKKQKNKQTNKQKHRTLENRAQNIQTKNPRTCNTEHQIIEHKNIKNVTLNIRIQNIRTFENVRKHQEILETTLIEFDNGKNRYVIVNPLYRPGNGLISCFHTVELNRRAKQTS